MKPLIVLLTAFFMAVLIIKVFEGDFDFALAARIAMSVMLAFTSAGHFAFTKGMTMMMPDFIPFKNQVVYLTGVFEILGAIGLLVSPFRVLTAWMLIAFFVLILPANINAAIKHIDYQKGTVHGNGPNYLWFRVPLQMLFILWIYFSSIRY